MFRRRYRVNRRVRVSPRAHRAHRFDRAEIAAMSVVLATSFRDSVRRKTLVFERQRCECSSSSDIATVFIHARARPQGKIPPGARLKF
jgi:hypothetical protein